VWSRLGTGPRGRVGLQRNGLGLKKNHAGQCRYGIVGPRSESFRKRHERRTNFVPKLTGEHTSVFGAKQDVLNHPWINVQPEFIHRSRGPTCGHLPELSASYCLIRLFLS
jgi:hypothetical protein